MAERRGVRRRGAEAGLKGQNLLSLLLVQPAPMLLELPFEDLLQAGLLFGDLAVELLPMVFHFFCKKIRILMSEKETVSFSIRFSIRF